MTFKGLFVGIDRYASPAIQWLSCARRDAVALHALFTDTLSGDTKLLIDAEATQAPRDTGQDIDEKLLPHLSPLGWEHINLTGDYIWQPNKLNEQGKFRPLRMLDEA